MDFEIARGATGSNWDGSGMADSTTLTGTTLLLGGARSGKSRLAVSMASQSGLAPIMLATATAGDAEMAERIARHRAERDARWETFEVALDLPQRLADLASPQRFVVVDCVSFWLANLLFANEDADAAASHLAARIADLKGPVAFVSNEVGSGIVPDNELARRFRDVQGRANQMLSAAAQQVVLVVAGLPLKLKG